MDFVRIGDKLISRENFRAVDRITLRSAGLSQQEAANQLS